MQLIEQKDGITNMHDIKESTHILRYTGRNGDQQYFDRGFGKQKNVDFEVFHYQDT